MKVAYRRYIAYFARAVATVALLLPFAYLLALLGVPPFGQACFQETRKIYRNLHGYHFEIVDTDCDVIAKIESVDVYARSIGVRRATRLFQYYPSNYDDALPDIEVRGQNEIIITIPTVSSIGFQRMVWLDRKIIYTIGKTLYP